MEHNDNSTPNTDLTAAPVVTELKTQNDKRDDIIRRLNEALARALDELTLDDRAA